MKTHTPATEALDKLNIPYRLESFSLEKKSIGPTDIAKTLGIQVDNIYKTLVIEGNHTSYLVAVVSVTQRLKLQQLATVSNNSNCKLIPMDALEELTGYVFAGCSPVGMKTTFPTYIQEDILKEKEIRMSGGRPGLFIVIKPEDLIKASNATLVDIINE